MYRGLLRGDTANRPRFTHLTEEGHEVHCFILGDYADALIRAEEARIDRLAMSDIKDAAEEIKPKRDRLIERLLELAAGHQ
jgi:hypothetical protein